MMWLKAAVRICKTQCPCVWGKNSAPMQYQCSATERKSIRQQPGCAGWESAEQRLAAGSMPIPNIMGAWSRHSVSLQVLILLNQTTCLNQCKAWRTQSHFSGALRTLAQDLIRIANDFRLLASGPSAGLDEIRLPAVQPGSSIMPGKVNPVLAEMMNMAMFQVIGNDTTIMMSSQAGQLELNVMMPVIAYNLFQSMDIIINAVNAFVEKCVVGVQANRSKAAGWLAKNAVLVTALNPVIGYQKGSEVAKEAMSSNRTLREVVIDKGYLSVEDADRLLNVRRLTDGGIQK